MHRIMVTKLVYIINDTALNMKLDTIVVAIAEWTVIRTLLKMFYFFLHRSFFAVVLYSLIYFVDQLQSFGNHQCL